MAKYSAIPEPTTDPASLRDSVLALKQAFEIHSGQRGNAPVAAVTNETLAAATETTNTAIAAANSASAANSAAITGLQASAVTIAGNSGAFTLNAASGVTNLLNDIKLSQASSSQFGAVKVDGTSITAVGGVISAALSTSTNSLAADVLLNNTANYFDGPSVAQGTSGTWFASGTVTITDTASSNCFVKLWDGTNVIASCEVLILTAGFTAVSLSGVRASPAGNIRISVRDLSTTTGKILFNATGTSKDSTITAIRIG